MPHISRAKRHPKSPQFTALGGVRFEDQLGMEIRRYFAHDFGLVVVAWSHRLLERETTSFLCENRYCFSVARWRVRDASLKPASNELVSCSKRVHFGLHFRSHEHQTLFLDLKQGDCSDFSSDFAREKCAAVKGIQVGSYPGLILIELLEISLEQTSVNMVSP
jgi:hypothetical protein